MNNGINLYVKLIKVFLLVNECYALQHPISTDVLTWKIPPVAIAVYCKEYIKLA
jgi:hypothetical protein